jgi:hypothetical protein
MRTSSIRHPANEPLIIIRQWQLKFCGGNTIAAALMSFFEYWYNIKFAERRKRTEAGIEPPEDNHDLLQHHNIKDLVNGIMHMAKHKETIGAAIDLLVKNGVITIHKNPSPRYSFDNTRFFLFHPNVVNEWLDSEYIPNKSSPKKQVQSNNNGSEPTLSEPTLYEKQLIRYLIDLFANNKPSLTEESAAKMIQTYGADAVEQQLEWLELRETDAPLRTLRAALKNSWTKPKPVGKPKEKPWYDEMDPSLFAN